MDDLTAYDPLGRVCAVMIWGDTKRSSKAAKDTLRRERRVMFTCCALTAVKRSTQGQELGPIRGRILLAAAVDENQSS